MYIDIDESERFGKGKEVMEKGAWREGRVETDMNRQTDKHTYVHVGVCSSVC